MLTAEIVFKESKFWARRKEDGANEGREMSILLGMMCTIIEILNILKTEETIEGVLTVATEKSYGRTKIQAFISDL